MSERARVIIDADADAVVRETHKAGDAVRGLGRETQRANRVASASSSALRTQRQSLDGVTRAAKAATVAVGALGAVGAGKAVRDGLQFNAQIEASNLALKRFLGSTKEAQKYTQGLFDTAKRTPFEFAGLQDAARKLLAFGLGAKQTKETLDAVGDAVAAMGGNAENIDRVVLALGQIQAKGKVYAEELLQLTEAGIPAYRILERELGLTKAQVAQIGQEGIKSSVALKALTAGLKHDFGGAAAEFSQTFSGQMSTLRDDWRQLTGALTKGLFDETKKWAPNVDRAMSSIAKVWNDETLSFHEKFNRSLDLVDRDLGPILDELGRKLKDADLGQRLADAVEDAAPKIADAAAHAAPKAAEAFVKAWLDMGPWGKLLTAGFLAKKVGVFSGAGSLAADLFAEKFRQRMAKSTAMTAAGTAATNGVAAGMAAQVPSAFSTKGKFGTALATSMKGLGVAAAAPLVFEISKAIVDGVEQGIDQLPGPLKSIAKVGFKISPVGRVKDAVDWSTAGVKALTGLADASSDASGSGGVLGALLRGSSNALGRSSSGQLTHRAGYQSGFPSIDKVATASLGGLAGGGGGASGRVTVGDAAVEWARGAIGHFAESAGQNRGPELDKLQKQFGMTAAAWCAMFATRAIVEGGAPEAALTASVAQIREWAGKGAHGYLKGLRGSPKRGDLMLFGNSHVGVVEKILSGGRVRTIEGNTSSGKVARRTHSISEGDFARPDYANPLGLPSDASTPVLTREQRIIRDAAKAAGIDPAILWGVYGQETRFGKLKGTSPAGARGPFQLMPGTARELGVKNPNDFKAAAYAAARYLARYKNRGTKGMLQAYNAGPNGNPDNPETKKYVPGVLKYAREFPTIAASGGSLDITPTDMQAVYAAIVEAIYRPIGRRLERKDKPLRGQSRSLGNRIDRLDTRMGLMARRFDLTDEDLGTPEGRSARVGELASLGIQTQNKIGLIEKRRAVLKRRLGIAMQAYQTAKSALKRAPKGAKGAKRAALVALAARIRDIKSELAALGEQVAGVKLDLAELDKEAQDTLKTPDTADESQSESWSVFDTDDLDIARAKWSGNKDAIRNALVKKRGDALYQLSVVAMQTPDPRDDAELIGVIMGLDDEIKALDETIEETNDNLREQLDLTKEMLANALRDKNVAIAQTGAFAQFAPRLAGRMVGSFARGTDYVPRTGLALVHEGETITSNPDGPFGNALTAAAAQPVVVQLTLQDRAGELVRLVDARIEGRAAAAVSLQQGRRTRLIRAAPGGARR